MPADLGALAGADVDVRAGFFGADIDASGGDETGQGAG